MDSVIMVWLGVMVIGIFFESYNLIFGEGREIGESDLILIDAVIIYFIIVFFIFFLGLGPFYLIASEKLYGKTLGKKLLSLIVVDYNGIKINWHNE
ncbi:MAG: RDD family protein [Candidatus Kariarchaeaceae archaeon]